MHTTKFFPMVLVALASTGVLAVPVADSSMSAAGQAVTPSIAAREADMARLAARSDKDKSAAGKEDNGKDGAGAGNGHGGSGAGGNDASQQQQQQQSQPQPPRPGAGSRRRTGPNPDYTPPSMDSLEGTTLVDNAAAPGSRPRTDGTNRNVPSLPGQGGRLQDMLPDEEGEGEEERRSKI